MKTLLTLCSVLFLAGCLSNPIAMSGGIGAVTVKNTTPDAVINAAETVFAGRDYTLSDSNYPTSISFDKPAGGFGNIMWGSYGNPQSIRVKIRMVQIPMTPDIRLEPSVYSVSNAGLAGFDDAHPLMGVWNAEFAPMLKQVAQMAGN
jgi:hypothetical protein